MAQNGQHSYTQGHSNYAIATHLTRTAESEAAFLLPYIKKTDHILDVGCGPGTITTGFAKYASEGKIVGIDISAGVLQKAKAIAAESKIPTEGPGSVVFEEGNILTGLPYPDETFDVIYSSQVFGHLPMPDLPLTAIGEMRRVLKKGGILAARDAVEQHFYPRELDLDRLWVQNQARGLRKGGPVVPTTAISMPSLLRKAGFEADEGKVLIGTAASTIAGPDARKWLAGRGTGQLQKGDALYKSWLEAGISEEEIQETLDAVKKWAEMDDAWYASLQGEMLAWK
jgi:ubiquinone/menaquinone biosynthesis C-methylase UbiE